MPYKKRYTEEKKNSGKFVGNDSAFEEIGKICIGINFLQKCGFLKIARKLLENGNNTL